MRTVHEGVKFDCDQCGYAATDKIYLKLHVEDAQIAHEGILHNCEQCDFIGKTALAFVSHISAVHDNIRFCCDQCDYVASKNYTLLVYARCETGLQFPSSETLVMQKRRKEKKSKKLRV